MRKIIFFILSVIFLQASMVEKGILAFKNKNYAKAFKLFKKACDNNDPLGCDNLGALYEEGIGVKKNYEKAIFYYKKACKSALGLGCYNLGNLYEKLKNYSKAIDSYELACNSLGFKKACFRLGKIYFSGKNVKMDKGLAYDYFLRACNLGMPRSCTIIGNMYMDGDGVERNYYLAYRYLKKACSMGDDYGCSSLNYLINVLRY